MMKALVEQAKFEGSPPKRPLLRLGQGAFTLVEVMVAMVVLAIVALGALGYEYYAASQARVACAQTAATRIGQLLLEDWKSTGGSEDYDPATLGLGFSTLTIPSHFSYSLSQEMGSPLHEAVYAITVDGVPMMIMLSWHDVAYDSVAEVTLRQIAVTVETVEDLKQQYDYTIQDDYPEGTITLSTSRDLLGRIAPPVVLTTYVRLDASGG